MLTLDLVPHGPIGDDVVAIPTPFAMAGETPGHLQVLHDALHGTLRDPDLVGEIAQSQLRVAGQADEHVAVVGEERPGPTVDARIRRVLTIDRCSAHALRLRTWLPEINFC